MSAVQFVLGLTRLAAIVLPTALAAHLLRRRLLVAAGALGVLSDATVALSLLIVVAELLGLVGLMRPAALIPTLVLVALIVWRRCRQSAPPARPSPAQSPFAADVPHASAVAAFVAVIVVAAQWCEQTADALGSGMFNFDTLWYHMPFAARFARTGSVTGIQFTQADPFVAYYPANSELLHAIGIGVLHGDFLSPLLNLMWLTIALLGAWCLGRRWRVEPLTLLAGCLVLSLPVLSGTQPGEAFNDVVGLAMLLAGAAIAVNAEGDRRMLAVAGLALGVAVGTKFTFLVPAFVLVAGLALSAKPRERRPTLGVLAGGLALPCGWWYLRNLIAVGNPIGLQLHLGPLTLPGPSSPLEAVSQQTVISELSHLSLWGSRFAPGLDHALGPLWPLVLLLYLAAVIAGLLGVRDPLVRVLAAAAALAGISYLLFPTGATAIEQGITEFQVNLRYVTPALALGIALVPILVRLRAPRALAAVAPVLVLVLLATQLEGSLWPTQTARHAAFLFAAAAVAAVVALLSRTLAARLRRRPALAIAAAALTLTLGGAAFVVQRHYFERRYLVGDTTEPRLGALYRWAQGIAHARIALYGTVQQYPLYGARDTNVLDYLGRHTRDGGFRPFATCAAWRTALNRGRYRYLVLTPAPTSAVPLAWTQDDPAARLVLSPGAQDYVFQVTGRWHPRTCA